MHHLKPEYLSLLFNVITQLPDMAANYHSLLYAGPIQTREDLYCQLIPDVFRTFAMEVYHTFGLDVHGAFEKDVYPNLNPGPNQAFPKRLNKRFI